LLVTEKCKYVLVHAVKAYREKSGTAPLNLDVRWRGVTNHEAAPVPP